MVNQHVLDSSAFPALPADLLDAFRQPFAPQEVRLRVGRRRQPKEGMWQCVALPVVERRFYEARLDALVPGGWSSTSPSLVVAADRLLLSACVQIGDISHTDYGEMPLKQTVLLDEVEELIVSVPEAFEQAFVRVCARFGLGRYLADLAREWVPYDAQRGRMALSPEQQQAHVLKLYQQANILLPNQPQPRGNTRTSGTMTKDAKRNEDLAWIRQQCTSHAGSLAGILKHWHVQRLEDLTDEQLVKVMNSIHQSLARTSSSSHLSHPA
jgi:hypothetical protein